MRSPDFIIIGAGIFGISTALSLAKRNHTVAVLNPGQIPHPLAASTDISKIIRVEYGSDEEYMDMALESLVTWREWNDLLGQTLFHETGFLLMTAAEMNLQNRPFEYASYQNLLNRNLEPKRLDPAQFSQQYPAFASGYFKDGFYHQLGGFAESGRLVASLARFASQSGVAIYEGETAESLDISNGRVRGVRTREGNHYIAGQVVVCAGNHTPFLVPELQSCMQITGHPVFHLKPGRPELFRPGIFPVFAADIATTGWYGFPIHPRDKVVKIANHGTGRPIHPDLDERIVSKAEISNLRDFLRQAIPALAEDPIVYTRLCCYTDTLDGHFWIDNHPEIKGLTIGSGGSGHGFKMGPVVGEMIADVAEGRSHKWSSRYNWRELHADTRQQEEARHKTNDKFL